MESPAEEGGGPTASPDEPASPAGTKEAVAEQGDPTELASSAKKIEHEQAVQHLISLIGDRQVQDALDVYQSASKTLEGRKVNRQDTSLF